ncbi:hypothetical protein MCUN1_003264 [Malassezia cuniculi]|uniref:Trans-2,3-dihydro-3-hydroxyanthranilate isomerase n=1 Tax=Malassezia cuniculi TaxID=948313 RepID=A0AAF0ETA8_9BASI|nr:hypothetical protein MCUN1_003264 [Malassezia cuniculi]
MPRTFTQVDVFAPGPVTGNPVAVVHEASGLSDEQMLAFARWTNLSETTFILPPKTDEADYSVRIFTPGGEIPFAGHPTLGTAHAWLENGGKPRKSDVVQHCGIGLVRIARIDGTLRFRAPNFSRYGDVDAHDIAAITAALGIAPANVKHASWIDNGPGWVGLVLESADAVLSLRPNISDLDNWRVGVIGPHATGEPADYESRTIIRGTVTL